MEIYCLRHYPRQALHYSLTRLNHLRNITDNDYRIILLEHYGVSIVHESDDEDFFFSDDDDFVLDSAEP